VQGEIWMPLDQIYDVGGNVFGFGFEYKYLAHLSDYKITINPDISVPLIATDDKVDKEKIRKRIDENLRLLNDDYATERDSALKEVFVEVLSEDQFMKFMELKGKIGSQHKFPRVMKGKMLEEWEKYLKEGCL